MSTRRPAASSPSSVRAAGSAIACRRLMAARPTRSTCARSASPARRWRGTPASPISPSRCRGWAAPRSRSSARKRSSGATCRKSREGRRIAAFALSEPEGGSDVAAMRTDSAREGDHYVLDGEKTWISNGGIAGHYVVFARTGEAPGAKGISRLRRRGRDARARDRRADRGDRAAPARARSLRGCRVPNAQLLGAAGRGVQDRDGDARHLPLDGRRRGARLRPARARRGGRPRQDARRRSARRSPSSS